MKRWLVWGIWVTGASLPAMAGAEEFSRALRTEDYAAAGLGKLSADEIARLDALVRDFKSGVLERARREAAVAEARAAKAEAQAAAVPATTARVTVVPRDQKKESEGGLLAKAKVMLTPGTTIEYATVESRLAGEFRGWEGRTLFTLENGQRWQATGSDVYVSPPVASPAVKISPGALGTFWLTVEGVKSRVKVVRVGEAR